MWVCLCGVWRLEVNLKCWPLPVSTLLFGAGSLPKPDDHWLARLADQWAQGIPLSTAMQHRMTGMCHYIRVFTRVLEIKHKSWLVYNNHFTNWAVSPCLLCSLWSLCSTLWCPVLCLQTLWVPPVGSILKRQGRRKVQIRWAGRWEVLTDLSLTVALVLYWKKGSWSKHSSVRTLVGPSRLAWSCPKCSKMIPGVLALLNIPLSPSWHFMHNLFPVSL